MTGPNVLSRARYIRERRHFLDGARLVQHRSPRPFLGKDKRCLGEQDRFANCRCLAGGNGPRRPRRRRIEDRSVQRQSRRSLRILQNFDRSRVAGIDLDEPGRAVAQDEIDAEEAAETATLDKDVAEFFQGSRNASSIRYRSEDTAAVVERRRVQPVFSDQLPGDAQELRLLSVAEKDRCVSRACDKLLEVNRSLPPFIFLAGVPEANARAARAGERFHEPASLAGNVFFFQDHRRAKYPLFG